MKASSSSTPASSRAALRDETNQLLAILTTIAKNTKDHKG
jgi:hypothetical protein